MASFDYSPGPAFEASLREAENAMAGAKEMKQRIAEVVGRAEAAEGRIYAEYKGEGGLSTLDIDPRALRLPSDELSREIRSAANAAEHDFRNKLNEVVSEYYGRDGGNTKGLADPQVAAAELQKISKAFADPMKDLMRELGVQQQRARSAMEQLRDPRQRY